MPWSYCHCNSPLTFATISGQSKESLRANSNNWAASTYTEGLLLALNITEGSLFKINTNPSTTAEAENISGKSWTRVTSAEWSVASGLRRDSFNCFNAPPRILEALASLSADLAALIVKTSSLDRTTLIQQGSALT